MGKRRAYRPRNQRGTRKPSPVVQGTLRVSGKGRATVETAEGVFAVARGGLREAMNGDEVRVSLVRRGGPELVAVVRDVVVRATADFVGTYDVADPLGVVRPLDARLRHDFFVLPEDTSAARCGVRAGDVVRVHILEYPDRRSAGVVTIDARLGSTEELDLGVESVIASYGFATAFSPAALAEAEGLTLDVDRALAADPLRRDLRDELTLTVDPTDARDFDDAVSARLLDGGGYELGVHIADVSHYVPWDSPIDLEARGRTTSVYLVDRVLPMLPERLCNDLCSLRPGGDRLTMSVRMELNARADVVSAEAFPAVIRSHARLDYDTVDALLDVTGDGGVAHDVTGDGGVARDVTGDGGVAHACPPDVAETLRILDEIGRLRRERRRERGAVDFDTRETKVTLDADGRPTGVSVRERTRATGLIEEAMLLANEAVARMLAQAEVPAPFRTHERPAPDDLKGTLPVLRELGVIDPGEEPALVAGSPFALQDVLRAAAGTSAAPLVTALLLRAQKRAVYLPHNDGHYALGADAYCHFTSPIRRYPDLVVHRALQALLHGRVESREQHAVARQLPQICRTCSDVERAADAAARATQKLKMAELFADHVGEDFSGVVMGCERFGLFVELDDTCAEGLLPVRALGDEYFVYDDARMALVGEESGRMWRVGQRVAVRVVRADAATGQIDFALSGGRR